MNWDHIPDPHRTVIMEGKPWYPKGGPIADGFTAMCLLTHDVGTAGPAECEIFGRKDTEANRIYLAVHILNCNCGWSHVL